MSNTNPVQEIESIILTMRGQRVILDVDLAHLYGVETKVLNQAIKRNSDRFPDDFVFRLTHDEKRQLVTDCDRFRNLKHSSALPNVFTEHGCLMAANVLNSPLAAKMSVHVIRTFVRLRQILANNRELSSKLDDLERKVGQHDVAIRAIVAT